MYDCPEFEGKGYKVCDGEGRFHKAPKLTNIEILKQQVRCDYEVYPCYGTGKCTVMLAGDRGLLRPDFAKKFLTGPDFKNQCENGKCRECHGTGITKSMFLKIRVKCYICKQRRICIVCNGNGKCTFCNGIGKFKCKACNGSGRVFLKSYEQSLKREEKVEPPWYSLSNWFRKK